MTRCLCMAVPFFLCFTLFSLPARAQIFNWNDDRDTVFSRLQSLIDQMNEGKDAIAAGNVRDTIDDAVQLLTASLPSQADVLAFQNQGCGAFRGDLTALTSGMFGLSHTLANFHGLPLEIPIQDPGLGDLIPQIPCSLLFPASRMSDRLGLMNAGLGDRFLQVADDLTVLKALIYPDSVDLPGNDAACDLIAERDLAVSIAHNGVRSVGIISLGLGTLLQAIGKTAVAGPDEVKVAIWGWVGSRIRNTPAMTIGNFLAGSGHMLLAVSAAASRTRNFCALSDEHEKLLAKHEALGDGQEEIIRLLLTPQGRRASSFCHDEECAQQSFPNKRAHRR